ncbi:hypothetical protein KFU94_03335 [Chloroflexi bacterium TSY]|nr:hypothetical protein [Chloroflexi bacterium TSY]
MITYEVTLSFSSGTFEDVLLQDDLERGLAFFGEATLRSSSGITSDLDGGFQEALTKLAFRNIGKGQANQGRRLQLNLGNLKVTQAKASDLEEIQFRYSAIVLNVPNNQAEQRNNLDNLARLTASGPNNAQYNVSASARVRIVESELSLNIWPEQILVKPTDTVTLTLHLSHHVDSNTSAFDLELTITLPEQLSYIPDSLTWLGEGKRPNYIIDSIVVK